MNCPFSIFTFTLIHTRWVCPCVGWAVLVSPPPSHRIPFHSNPPPSWQQQQSPLLSSPTFLPATAKTATTRTTEQLFFPSSLPRPPSHRPRPAAEGDLDFFTSAGPSVRPMALSLSLTWPCAHRPALSWSNPRLAGPRSTHLSAPPRRSRSEQWSDGRSALPRIPESACGGEK